MLSPFLLPNMDSNHDTQNQNLMYYPYTIGQFLRKRLQYYETFP